MRRSRTRLPARCRARLGERGVGLLEVLVTVLVLSIGFLAAGALQLRALRDGQEAYHTSQAQLMLDDMMDRMRNNAIAVDGGAYDNRRTDATAAASVTSCASDGCTPAQLAARDLTEWSARLAPGGATAALLPPAADGSAAEARISAPNGGVYTLTLVWGAFEGDARAGQLSVRFVP